MYQLVSDEFEKVWVCRSCQHKFVPLRSEYTCPKCGSQSTYSTRAPILRTISKKKLLFLSIIILTGFYIISIFLISNQVPGDPIIIIFPTITSKKTGTELIFRSWKIRTTHLHLKRPYKLKFIAFTFAGGDLLGYPVALHSLGIGFKPDFMNQKHVAYLFKTIDSPEEALELVQLAYHRSRYSAYGREFTEITSNDMYLLEVADMNETSGEDFNVISHPPVNYTRVKKIEGGFSVERIFKKKSGLVRLVYMKVLVYNNGSIIEVENYTFIEGSFGYLL